LMANLLALPKAPAARPSASNEPSAHRMALTARQPTRRL
jgi:hypothetical protein